MPYEYAVVRAARTLKLFHVMRTAPSNINLRYDSTPSSVSRQGYLGINGGFFAVNTNYLLSIAIENDVPVRPGGPSYNSGYYNADRTRGTLVFDRQSPRVSVQNVNNAGQIQVTNRKAYWAQGGVNMELAAASWTNTQGLPDPDSRRPRTGMVFDRNRGIYLIITTHESPMTATEFRDAIKSFQSPIKLAPFVNGIFLDSGSSTQMNAGRDFVYNNGSRGIPQTVTLNEATPIP